MLAPPRELNQTSTSDDLAQGAETFAGSPGHLQLRTYRCTVLIDATGH
jgi:hypothetical protein